MVCNTNRNTHLAVFIMILLFAFLRQCPCFTQRTYNCKLLKSFFYDLFIYILVLVLIQFECVSLIVKQLFKIKQLTSNQLICSESVCLDKNKDYERANCFSFILILFQFSWILNYCFQYNFEFWLILWFCFMLQMMCFC